MFYILCPVDACNNIPVRSAVDFGKPRIFVTVTISRPLIGRKHRDTHSSPRSPASILKLKIESILIVIYSNFEQCSRELRKRKSVSKNKLICYAKVKRQSSVA